MSEKLASILERSSAWGWESEYDETREGAPWIQSPFADVFFGVLIVLSSVVLAVDIGMQLDGGDSSSVAHWIHNLFLLVFLLELCLRVRADGLGFFSCRNPVGLLDVAVVLGEIAGRLLVMLEVVTESVLGAISALRFFRLLRIGRALRVCPELSLEIKGLAASTQAVVFASCFLCVVMYVGSLFCALLLGQSEEPELRYFFGSVSASFYTHFMFLTLEGYPVVARAASKQTWVWYYYFVAFILFCNVVLMNLVTGIVCEYVVSTPTADDLEQRYDEDVGHRFLELCQVLYTNEGHRLDHRLTFEDVRELMRIPGIRKALNVLDVCLDIEDERLFSFLDTDGNGSLDFKTIVKSLLRLRGTRETPHSFQVQADLALGTRHLGEQLRDTEEDIREYGSTLCSALQGRLKGKVDDLLVRMEETAKEELCAKGWASRAAPLPGDASDAGAHAQDSGTASAQGRRSLPAVGAVLSLRPVQTPSTAG